MTQRQVLVRDAGHQVFDELTDDDLATPPGGAVDSVNGQTGVVVLAASDVGADVDGAAAAAQAAAEAASDPAGTASSAVSTHAGLSDPHPGYLTPAEGNAAYDASGAAAAAQSAAATDATTKANAAQAAAIAASQPVDSDLTAIAALTTTSYGRALLALADAAAARTALALGTAATHATGDYDAAGAATAAVAAEATARDAAIAAAVAALINSAPGVLDTLEEIADALGDDPNFAATMTTALAGKQPLDSDLTAIAALTTTSFGRGLLALADAAALRTSAGLGTLATQSGTFSGTSSGTNTGDVAFGTTAGTAAQGNDARLSDTRTPTDASVTDAKIATTLSPSKIAGTAVVTADSRLSDSRAPSGAAGGDLAGTYPNPTVAQASAAFALPGDISPTQLAANTDNWNPTGLSTAAVIRATTDASRNLTGLVGGVDGRIIVLSNVGSFNLVLMHDVTSTAANRFYCLNGQNVTMPPNSSVLMVYDATSSRWRVNAVGYGTPTTQAFGDAAVAGTVETHKHGMPAAPAAGALVLLEQHTASASATLDFTTCISATYDEYRIELLNIIPATDAQVLGMRVSTDGGSTYDAGTNYHCGQWGFRAGGSALGGGGASQTRIFLDLSNGGGVSNASTGGLSGHLTLYNPGSATVYKRITGQVVSWESSGSVWLGTDTWGTYQSATAVNAFRFLFASGNITSGTIRVYGVAKT